MSSSSFDRFGYRKINSQILLGEFLKEIRWFHDSVIKEVHIVNRIYVNNELAIVCIVDNNSFSARVLVQQQFPDAPAIELLCIGIKQFVLSDNLFILDAEGSVELDNDGSLASIRLVFDESDIIQCQQLWIRLVPDWTGKTLRFGDFHGLEELI